MKKLIMKGFILFFLLCNLFVCVGCNETKNHIIDLKMASITQNEKYLTKIIQRFNENNSQYNITVDFFDTKEEMYYKFIHKVIKPDFILFNNYNDANNWFNEKLAPLNQYEFVGKYKSDIISTIKREEDKNLYVLPADGVLFTETYNLDILYDLGVELPDTINDLKLLSSRIHNAGIIPNVQDGKNYILNTLLEVLSSTFLTTVKGDSFLDDYSLGKTTIEGNEYIYQMLQSVLNDYLLLYGNGYFDLNNIDHTNEDAVQSFLKEESCSMLNTKNSSLLNENMDFNYALYPFVGYVDSEKYIASKPLFYMGSPKESIENNRKTNGIISFYKLFSSEEGRDLLKNAEDLLITYTNYFSLGNKPEISYIEDAVMCGRNYLVDKYYAVFSNFEEILLDYVKSYMNGIIESFDSLVKKMDRINTEKNANSNIFYGIAEDYDFSIENKETAMGNYIADILRKETGSNISIVNKSFINYNIYKGKIYDYELNVIFDNVKGAKMKISGQTIYDLMKEYLSSDEKFPIFSGIRVIYNKKNGFELYTLDKQKLNKDTEYTVIISQMYYPDLIKARLIPNNEMELIEILRKYFSTNGFISPLYLDNRYGK